MIIRLLSSSRLTPWFYFTFCIFVKESFILLWSWQGCQQQSWKGIRIKTLSCCVCSLIIAGKLDEHILSPCTKVQRKCEKTNKEVEVFKLQKYGGTHTWAQLISSSQYFSCKYQPGLQGALLLRGTALAPHSQARWKALLLSHDPSHIISDTECAHPQPLSLYRTNSSSQTKFLRSPFKSFQVFKSSSVHCTSPDAAGIHFKDSPSFLGGKGHEYQSLKFKRLLLPNQGDKMSQAVLCS